MSKILIIEDEMTIVDLISFNLKREGFEVDSAYDGVTGLEKALSGWADLILLDVMLPGMNGFDVLPPEATIKVIIMGDIISVNFAIFLIMFSVILYNEKI